MNICNIFVPLEQNLQVHRYSVARECVASGLHQYQSSSSEVVQTSYPKSADKTNKKLWQVSCYWTTSSNYNPYTELFEFKKILLFPQTSMVYALDLKIYGNLQNTVNHRISCKRVAKYYLILCKQLNNGVTNYKDFWFLFLCLGNKSFMLHHTQHIVVTSTHNILCSLT